MKTLKILGVLIVALMAIMACDIGLMGDGDGGNLVPRMLTQPPAEPWNPLFYSGDWYMVTEAGEFNGLITFNEEITEWYSDETGPRSNWATGVWSPITLDNPASTVRLQTGPQQGATIWGSNIIILEDDLVYCFNKQAILTRDPLPETYDDLKFFQYEMYLKLFNRPWRSVSNINQVAGNVQEFELFADGTYVIRFVDAATGAIVQEFPYTWFLRDDNGLGVSIYFEHDLAGNRLYWNRTGLMTVFTRPTGIQSYADPGTLAVFDTFYDVNGYDPGSGDDDDDDD